MRHVGLRTQNCSLSIIYEMACKLPGAGSDGEVLRPEESPPIRAPGSVVMR
jgi:hypothetical protein